jgi:hypothetical protein
LAGDQRHLMASTGQQATKIAPNGAGADNAEMKRIQFHAAE